MRPLLIVNPRSGGGRTGETFEPMRAPIGKALGDFDVAMTERPRHAVELARDAAKGGREMVIAVGGDGTIHEVVNGLMQARDAGARSTRLGIIGQGTGGDFRKSIGLEHRLDRYCEAIAAGKALAIDVGRFSYFGHDGAPASAFFVNILSAGIGGLVDRYVAETTKAFGGKAAYFVASLRGLLQSEIAVLACTIRCDGATRVEEIRTRSIAVCNGRYFGGGMQVAPMARVDDGSFDVVDLGHAPRIRFATVSSKMYSGEHIAHPDVKHFRCDRIEMQLAGGPKEFLLDVDGEPLGRLPLTIELERGALEVYCPGPGAAV